MKLISHTTGNLMVRNLDPLLNSANHNPNLMDSIIVSQGITLDSMQEASHHLIIPNGRKKYIIGYVWC